MYLSLKDTLAALKQYSTARLSYLCPIPERRHLVQSRCFLSKYIHGTGLMDCLFPARLASVWPRSYTSTCPNIHTHGDLHKRLIG